MSQNLTLRQAAKKIYEENSLRVSTCYELENLQEINVIFMLRLMLRKLPLSWNGMFV